MSARILAALVAGMLSVVPIAHRAGSRSPGPEHIHPVIAGPVAIWGLGDSLTAGFRDPAGEGYRRGLDVLLAARQHAWAGTLADAAGRHHDGHGGYEASDLTPMAAGWESSAAAQAPGATLEVLLMAGTNDIRNGDSPARAAADLAVLLQTVQRPGVVIVMATIPLIPGKEDLVRDFNGRVAALAAAQRLPLADMQTAVPESLLVDGLHPDAAGYDAMAAAWYAVMPR